MDKPNILIDSLPDTLCVDGREYPIRTDFRYCIMLEMLIFDQTIEPEYKPGAAIDLIFEEQPYDREAAVDELLWFYSCGHYEKPQEEGQENNVKTDSRQKRVYDFDVDADRIYAAFLDQYGIDLAEEELHWWKFQALFASLKSDNEICKIIEYRSVNLASIKNKAERKRMAELQRKYALPCNLSEEQKVAMAGSAFAGR